MIFRRRGKGATQDGSSSITATPRRGKRAVTAAEDLHEAAGELESNASWIVELLEGPASEMEDFPDAIEDLQQSVKDVESKLNTLLKTANVGSIDEGSG